MALTDADRMVISERPPGSASGLSVLDAPDPLDFVDDPDGIVSRKGVVIRTDFSNDEKWSSFCEALLKSEREGMADIIASNAPSNPAADPSTAPGEGDEGDSDSSDGEDEQGADGDGDTAMAPGDGSDERSSALDNAAPGGSSSDAFIILDPSTGPSESTSPSASAPAPATSPSAILPAALCQNATNLTLLRLFNDIDIAPCLPVPQGRKRVKGSLGLSPSVRLVDSHGFHEVYSGRMIWVYDTKSNTDGCARLITQRPTYYGLST